MKILKMLKKSLYIILFFIFLFSGVIGMSNILEKIKITGTFNSLLTYILSILFFIMLYVDLRKFDDRKKLLNIAKNVFSLDYTNLKNISRIDYDDNCNFIIYLKNGLHYSLDNYNIPKTQQDLQALDDSFSQIHF